MIEQSYFEPRLARVGLIDGYVDYRKVPLGAILVSSHYVFFDGEPYMIFWHPSFNVVKDGEEIPTL